MSLETLFLRAIDPIHVGTGGYSLGRVDNSILRDPTTNIPKIPGTALSGASRHYAAETHRRAYPKNQICAGQKGHCGDCPVCYTFGYSSTDSDERAIPETTQKDKFAGTVNVFDAHILLFPTSSIYGTVWVTTESLLNDICINIPSEIMPCTTNNRWANKRINLGWQMIEALKLGELNLDQSIEDIVSDRIVVIDEDRFGLVVNGNLEVRTSVAIDPKTGTAEDKALFTYEAIPRNTIFMMDVLEDDYRRDSLSSKDSRRSFFPATVDNIVWYSPMDVLKHGLRMIATRGVGGMGTRGFGRLKWLEEDSDSGTNIETGGSKP